MEKFNDMLDFPNKDILYSDNNITIIKSFVQIQELTDNIFIDGYLVVYIRSGHVAIRLNGQNYDIEAGNILTCTPRTIIEYALVNINLEVLGFVCTTDYAQKIMDITHVDLKIRLRGEDVPQVFKLSESQYDLYNSMLKTISFLFGLSGSAYRDKAILCQLQSFVYTLAGFISDNTEPENYSITTEVSAGDILLNKFINLLEQRETRFLSVNEYAAQLFVTPKYLSATCKRLCGKTASQFINDSIIREAKILLQNPNLSIKDISNMLGFANPSHFGVFIRRHTKMSPQELRGTV